MPSAERAGRRVSLRRQPAEYASGDERTGSDRDSEGALPVKQVMMVLVLAFIVGACGVKNDPKSPGKSYYPRSYPTKQ